MAAIHETPQNLEVRILPDIAGMITLFSVMTVIAGGTFLSLTAPIFSCSRTSSSVGECQLVEFGIRRSSVIFQVPLSEIEEAMQANQSVVLKTRQGDRKLPEIGQESIDRINNFLANPEQTTLKIGSESKIFFNKYSAMGAVIATPILLALVGGSSVINCVFDKRLGKFFLKRQRLVGTEVCECPLSEIAAVELEKFTASDPGEKDSYRIVLLLKSGDRILIRHLFSEGYREKMEVVDRIRMFLKL